MNLNGESRSMPSNPIKRWQPGDSIVLRGVWRHKVWWACSATIVQDTPDLIAIYWRAGTPNRVPDHRPLPQDLLTNNISLVAHKWVGTDVLMLVTPGAAHAVNVMWETGQTKLRCWYIDLQDPLRRTGIGFDSMDHLLDVDISPDRSEWHWKDEDEFEQAVKLGVYSPEEAGAIRLEGERVIRILQQNGSPFCDGWERWSPPPEWEIPCLPVGWDT